MYFFYDGTYVGFLTTVYEIYHHGTSHLEGILVEGGEVPLFGAQSIVITRLPDAEKVADVPGLSFQRRRKGNENLLFYERRI